MDFGEVDLRDLAISLVALVLGIAFLAFVLSVLLAMLRSGWDGVRTMLTRRS